MAKYLLLFYPLHTIRLYVISNWETMNDFVSEETTIFSTALIPFPLIINIIMNYYYYVIDL